MQNATCAKLILILKLWDYNLKLSHSIRKKKDLINITKMANKWLLKIYVKHSVFVALRNLV